MVDDEARRCAHRLDDFILQLFERQECFIEIAVVDVSEGQLLSQTLTQRVNERIVVLFLLVVLKRLKLFVE